MRSIIVLCLILLFAPCISFAEKLPADLEQNLQLMTNGQLLEAYSGLQEIHEQRPEDVAATFLLALSKWKMMWLSTYSQTDRQMLVELLDRVDFLCKPEMDQDKDLLFYHTSVFGLRSQLAATENQWWETAQLGKKMKNEAQKLYHKDPEYYQAYYLLGSYNYFADALPGYLKFLRTFAFLPGGDRIGGLKQLIVAYEKGETVSSEAGRTLVMIYTYFEKRHDFGIQMCDMLLTPYPQAYDLGLYKGINLYFSKSFEKSVDWLQHVRSQIREYSQKHESEQILPVYFPMEREVRYWMARNLIQLHRYPEARELLMDLIKPEIHQPWWLMRGVYLSLAQIEYQVDQPEQAEKWLSMVLRWRDVKDSHNKANLLRKKKGNVDMFDIDIL